MVIFLGFDDEMGGKYARNMYKQLVKQNFHSINENP